MKASLTESAAVDDLPGPSQPPPAWAGAWPQSPEQFEAFIDVFQHRLVYYALRRLGNIQDAEDVIQEVFVKVFVRRANYRGVERVTPYLYRMAANACTDFLRRRRAAQTISIEELEGDALHERGAGAAEAVAAMEEVSRIEATLGRLPGRQAEVIRLRVFDELSLAEIARMLGCSLPTVKSRLRYGLTRLRAWFSRERRQS